MNTEYSYGLDVSQLKHDVVEEALKAIDLYSDSAVNLVTGTALAESAAHYLRQLNNGPALGLWQMEPLTHNDLWMNFLHYRKDLVSKLNFLMNGQDRKKQLIANLPYGAAMCRILYFRSPVELPVSTDAYALSHYHKQIYNTIKGKADEQKNTPYFAAAIKA